MTNDKRIPALFTIKGRIKEDFMLICKENNVSASRIIEGFMSNISKEFKDLSIYRTITKEEIEEHFYFTN